VAELCWHKAHYAASLIAPVSGYTVDEGEFFHEFVVHCPVRVDEINRRLYETHGIIGGFDLAAQYPEMKNCMLVCCTEMNSREEIDRFVSALKEAGNA
jgi:glycine dehydrogenase subunit 1